MKRLVINLVLAIVLMVPVFALAEEWVTANQVTVAWDAVTVPDGTVSYFVYVKNTGTGNLLGTIDTVNGKALLETTNLQAAIAFTEEGKYHIGVATKRIPNGQTEELVSIVNWSNVNGESTPNPFGVSYFVIPASPINLRIQ
jgi:hypothetical protein